MFWLWPSLKDACQRPGYICGKFLEIFILENVLNMPLYLNDSLAGYSILETKILFFFSFKLSDNFFYPSLVQDSLHPHYSASEHIFDGLKEFWAMMLWRNSTRQKNPWAICTLYFYITLFARLKILIAFTLFLCVNKYEMAKLLNFKCNNIHFLECRFCMKWPNLWFRNVLVQAHIYSGHILVELDQVNCLILLFFNFISFWIPSFLSYSIFPMP